MINKHNEDIHVVHPPSEELYEAAILPLGNHCTFSGVNPHVQ